MFISVIAPCVLCWAVNNNLWVSIMKISSLQNSNKEQKPIALGPRPLSFHENFSSLPFTCLRAYKLNLVWLPWKPDSFIFRFLSHHPCLLEEPKAMQLIVYSWNRWSTHLIILQRQRHKCFWICSLVLETVEVKYWYTEKISFKEGLNIHMLSKVPSLTNSIREIYSIYVEDLLSEVNLHLACL